MSRLIVTSTFLLSLAASGVAFAQSSTTPGNSMAPDASAVKSGESTGSMSDGSSNAVGSANTNVGSTSESSNGATGDSQSSTTKSGSGGSASGAVGGGT